MHLRVRRRLKDAPGLARDGVSPCDVTAVSEAMAKHATSDNESEATSPKRARKDTNQSSLPPSSPPALADSEPQQDEPSEDEGAMDEEEDEEQQARATQKVREMQKKKTGVGPRSRPDASVSLTDPPHVQLVGMAGIIEQVHLENFMVSWRRLAPFLQRSDARFGLLQSHRLTTVNFGPQINFINGNNGSGKSAILTAITMALGGNAKLTVSSRRGALLRSAILSPQTCRIVARKDPVSSEKDQRVPRRPCASRIKVLTRTSTTSMATQSRLKGPCVQPAVDPTRFRMQTV